MKLVLGPEDYSPALVRKIVRHGAKDAFEEASEDLREDVGIAVTPKQVQRITERVGTEWVRQRDRDTAAFREGRLSRLHAEAPRASAVMPDGGRLQVRESHSPPGVHGPAWREPKYGCCLTLDSEESRTDPQPSPPETFLDSERVARLVGEVAGTAVPARRPSGAGRRAAGRRKARARTRRRRRPAPRCLVRTAVATMRRSDMFGEHLAMEAYRRSLDLAMRKAFVGDGEAYNWAIWSEHFRLRGFVPILDFMHLLTYVYSAAQAAGGPARRRWARYEKWLRWAWSGERASLLSALTRCSRRTGEPPKNAGESDPRSVLASARTYVINNLDKMDYPRYRKLGLPTSSAPVESEIKRFNRRVKGTEKFWTEEGVEAVLEARAAYLSEDGRAERNWAMPRPSYRSVGRNRLALVN